MMARRKARGSRAGLRRGELSRAEIEKSGPQQPGEGFSIRTSGRGAGGPARNVFSVGYAPETGRGAEVSVDPREPAADQLLAFNRDNADVLGTPGANMIQGGWHDPDSGVVQQDTSVALPLTASGLGAAMAIGAQSRQEAIGMLGPSAKNPYIRDVNIPKHLHPGQFVWEEGTSPRVETEDRVIWPNVSQRRVTITPTRDEMVGVEADILAEQMGLPKD